MAMPNMDKERKHRPPFPETPESPTPWENKICHKRRHQKQH